MLEYMLELHAASILLMPVFFMLHWHIAGIPIILGAMAALYKRTFRYVIYGIFLTLLVGYFGTLIYLLCCFKLSIP